MGQPKAFNDEQTQCTEVMKSPYPQLFARYLLLRPLMDGGMASISLARYLGSLDGVADKLMAIKTIKPDWSKDENFKKMFMDEIKVVFGLNHPNIVQAYDYGIFNEQLYLVMEYLDGFNLRQFEKKLKDLNKWFSIDTSVYIVKEICQALNHAHQFKNKLTGQDYEIVHRDISPDNVMISSEGHVKVIDFGIAKAAINSGKTRTGMIKGKSSYLAPEYLKDQSDLTHLSDQFSTGLVLWELLTGRKCFNEKKEMDNLVKIVESKIMTPKEVNPKIPEELSEITMKALNKNPDERYKNIGEFANALNIFLNQNYPEFNSNKVKRYAHHLFGKEIKENDKTLRECGEINAQDFIEELKNTNPSNSSLELLSSIAEQVEDGAENNNQTLNFTVSSEHLPENKTKQEKDLTQNRLKKVAEKVPKKPDDLGLNKNPSVHLEATSRGKNKNLEEEKEVEEEGPLLFREKYNIDRLIRYIKRAAIITLLFILGFGAYQWHFAPNHGVIGQLLYKTGVESITPEALKYQQKREEKIQQRREESTRELQERLDQLRI